MDISRLCWSLHRQLVHGRVGLARVYAPERWRVTILRLATPLVERIRDGGLASRSSSPVPRPGQPGTERVTVGRTAPTARRDDPGSLRRLVPDRPAECPARGCSRLLDLLPPADQVTVGGGYASRGLVSNADAYPPARVALALEEGPCRVGVGALALNDVCAGHSVGRCGLENR